MIGFEVLILLLAGLGAGVVTGFFGASAAIVAAPIMILFLKYDPFVAIGISLACDVFASLTTSYTYNKHKNLNLKPALVILFSSVIGAFVGSYYSSYFSSDFLSTFVASMVVLAGIHLITNNTRKEITFFKEETGFKRKALRFIFLAVAGFIVGNFAGVLGTGGGVTLVIILAVFLGYSFHRAIGTSVFVMAFISLSGAIGHIVYGEFLVLPIVIASIGGIVGAWFSSRLANKTSEEKLNKVGGILILLLGIFLLLESIFFRNSVF